MRWHEAGCVATARVLNVQRMSCEETGRKEALERAFDESIAVFWKEPTCVLGSKAEKVRILFDNIRRGWKQWERSGPCMYRGCGRPSVRHSHAIQKSGPLARIAEDQHVLSPRPYERRHLTMQRIGVNLASTFPGFCEEHELLFADFEATGQIASTRHLALQGFRTLCGEIARKRHALEGVEAYLETYRKARFRFFDAAIKRVRPSTGLKDLEITGDRLEDYVSSKIQDAKADLQELEGELYDELYEYIEGGSVEPCLEALLLPYEVPVSLSGLASLTYEHAAQTHHGLCILGIMPQPGSTLAFVGVARRHTVLVEYYMARMRVI